MCTVTYKCELHVETNYFNLFLYDSLCSLWTQSHSIHKKITLKIFLVFQAKSMDFNVFVIICTFNYIKNNHFELIQFRATLLFIPSTFILLFQSLEEEYQYMVDEFR